MAKITKEEMLQFLNTPQATQQDQGERSDYRRGYDDGVQFALDILKTEDALTGNPNTSVCIALRTMLSSAALPNGADGGEK